MADATTEQQKRDAARKVLAAPYYLAEDALVAVGSGDLGEVRRQLNMLLDSMRAQLGGEKP